MTPGSDRPPQAVTCRALPHPQVLLVSGKTGGRTVHGMRSRTLIALLTSVIGSLGVVGAAAVGARAGVKANGQRRNGSSTCSRSTPTGGGNDSSTRGQLLYVGDR